MEYLFYRVHPVNQKGNKLSWYFDKNECRISIAETNFFTRCIYPGQMSKMRVDTACNNLRIYILELTDTIRECQNFGWAYECAEIINDIVFLFFFVCVHKLRWKQVDLID